MNFADSFRNIIESTNLIHIYKMMGISGNPTREGLLESERIINEKFPMGHIPLPTTLIPFGIQLGNALIEHLPNSKWIYKDAKNINDVTLLTPLEEGVFIASKPFSRVHHFWRNNRKSTMSKMLASLIFCKQYHGLLSTEPHLILKPVDKDGWYEIPGGDKIRVKTILRKDYQKHGISFGDKEPELVSGIEVLSDSDNDSDSSQSFGQGNMGLFSTN